MDANRQAFMEEYEGFRVDVPEGRHGLYEVRRKVMTERDALVSNIMESVLRTGRHATPGTYTQLVRYGRRGNPYEPTIVMTDHLCEVADHEPLVTFARSQPAPLAHVLINGLGLGVAIELLAPYVERLTIVEVSASVIRLVAPHYRAKYPGLVEIVHANALTYQPPKGVRYSAVFHDIWDTITHENLAEMRHLHRRYGRLTDWQASWARNYCERERRKRQRHPERYEHEVSMSEVMESINLLLAITETQP